MDIGDYRREYMSQGLDLADLDDNPFKQFELWFQQARDADIQDANAFSIATCDPDTGPSVRTVLLKLFDEEGFVFFTNYNSSKSKQIQRYPHVAMLFPWLVLNRQVRIEGKCEKISSASSLKYFATRPRGSQIGAWCSDQSEVIESRSFLEQKYREAAEKFKTGSIPLPSSWGGYRIVPKRFEFWQGRENRLHDRLQYLRNETDGWDVQRLAP